MGRAWKIDAFCCGNLTHFVVEISWKATTGRPRIRGHKFNLWEIDDERRTELGSDSSPVVDFDTACVERSAYTTEV
jgi:hypothetical protein